MNDTPHKITQNDDDDKVLIQFDSVMKNVVIMTKVQYFYYDQHLQINFLLDAIQLQ